MTKKPEKFYHFDKVYIENSQKVNPKVINIISNLSGNYKIEYVDNIYSLIKKLPPLYHPQERAKNLYLGSIRGDIVKKCPGTHGHLCCNYYVINLYIGCPINCTYCILQSYLNQPFIIINVDLENIFDYLDNIYKNNPCKTFRIGTGEAGDSLVYDYLTGFSKDFIDFFRDKPDFIFEFKTKTDYVDEILCCQSPGNIVIGFSVNPQDIIYGEESFAAKLKERLIAAKNLTSRGYKVAFHFDPIICISDFETKYYQVIQLIFEYVEPCDISWISLGTFRYTPDLKSMIEYNYPDTKILDEEFLECADKKWRYFKPIRLALYQKITKWIYEKDKNILVYLCMESPYIWRKSLGFLPYSEKKIELVFKKAMMKK